MIPSMRNVIKKFNACRPAMYWSTDMSVQEGYEVCTEPGWLMLLIFSIRNSKNALSFAQTMDVAHRCVQRALYLTHDQRLLDSVSFAMAAIPQELPSAAVRIKADRQYAIDRDKGLYSDILARGLEPSLVLEMYLCKVVAMFLGIMEFRDNVTIAAKAAHSAIDFVVLTLVAEKYPDFIASAVHALQKSDPTDIKIFRLAKKVELCGILRQVAPQPFTTYE